MDKINDRYEVIEEIKSENRVLYKSLDTVNSKEVFVEVHSIIDGSDWGLGGKVNDELRKLKLSNTIIEYFYKTKAETKEKIFYKVFSENPFEKAIREEKRRKEKEKEEEEERELIKSNKRRTRKERVKSKKVVHTTGIERILICDVCKEDANLRKLNATQDKVYCETCRKETKVSFKTKEMPKKSDVKKPTNYKVKETENKLLIEITPSKAGILLVMFMFFPIVFILLIQGETGMDMLILLLAIGALFIVIIKFLDKNYIEVANGVLSTYTKPLSMSKPQKYKLKEIDQLYVKKKGKYKVNKDLDLNNRRAGLRRRESLLVKELKYLAEETDTYHLVAILKGGKGDVNLFKTHNPKDATYLENLIENYLGIEDIEIRGEVQQ